MIRDQEWVQAAVVPQDRAQKLQKTLLTSRKIKQVVAQVLVLDQGQVPAVVALRIMVLALVQEQVRELHRVQVMEQVRAQAQQVAEQELQLMVQVLVVQAQPAELVHLLPMDQACRKILPNRKNPKPELQVMEPELEQVHLIMEQEVCRKILPNRKINPKPELQVMEPELELELELKPMNPDRIQL
jgi:hypothetical protein